MLKKLISHPNYDLLCIKTDKFKSCHIEVSFRNEIKEHDLIERSFLTDLMSYSTLNYPTKKEWTIKREELYNLSLYGYCTRLGNIINTYFSCSFVAPKYIKEEEYLEEIVKTLMEMIFNPNVINNAFDLKSFNVVKNKMKSYISDSKEDPYMVSISNGLNTAFPNSVSRYGIIKEEDYLEEITPDLLYTSYENMIKNDQVTVFAIGDMDSNYLDSLIHKYFNCNIIKNNSYRMYVENNLRKKPLVKEGQSSFVQTQLLMIYNFEGLTKELREVVPYIFNNIFGNGSLNSKLFRYLREENSLCYGVGSMNFKYDNIAIIKVSLAKDNISKAIKLIKKAVKEMQTGDFSLEELEDAKKSATFSIKIAQNNILSTLNNYIFNYYDDFSLPEDRLKRIKSITKEDIIKFAKCLKLNTIYTLNEGGSDERNNN